MNKAYIISLTTALGLGYAAGFATDGLTAEAAMAGSHTEVVTFDLDAAAQDSFEVFFEYRSLRPGQHKAGPVWAQRMQSGVTPQTGMR